MIDSVGSVTFKKVSRDIDEERINKNLKKLELHARISKKSTRSPLSIEKPITRSPHYRETAFGTVFNIKPVKEGDDTEI